MPGHTPKHIRQARSATKSHTARRMRRMFNARRRRVSMRTTKPKGKKFGIIKIL